MIFTMWNTAVDVAAVARDLSFGAWSDEALLIGGDECFVAGEMAEYEWTTGPCGVATNPIVADDDEDEDEQEAGLLDGCVVDDKFVLSDEELDGIVDDDPFGFTRTDIDDSDLWDEHVEAMPRSRSNSQRKNNAHMYIAPPVVLPPHIVNYTPFLRPKPMAQGSARLAKVEFDHLVKAKGSELNVLLKGKQLARGLLVQGLELFAIAAVTATAALGSRRAPSRKSRAVEGQAKPQYTVSTATTAKEATKNVKGTKKTSGRRSRAVPKVTDASTGAAKSTSAVAVATVRTRLPRQAAVKAMAAIMRRSPAIAAE